MVCVLAQMVTRVGRSPQWLGWQCHTHPCCWGPSLSCRGLNFPHRTVNPHLAPCLGWFGAAEGKVGLWVPASPLGCVLRSSHALIHPLYCPNVSSASPLQPLIPGACAWAGIGDAAISIPWERFDQGRMCWSLVVTEQLGPAHLSREGGNINPII